MRLRLFAVISLGVAALGLAAGPAAATGSAPSTAAADSPGWSVGTHLYTRTYGSALCLTAHTSDEATIQRCDGSRSQDWKVRAITTVHLSETFTAYQISNGYGSCLVPDGDDLNTSGTGVRARTCATASTHHRQVWIALLGFTDSPYGSWNFANGTSGLFLCAKDNDTVGSRVYEYNLNKGPATEGLIFAGAV